MLLTPGELLVGGHSSLLECFAEGHSWFEMKDLATEILEICIKVQSDFEDLRGFNLSSSYLVLIKTLGSGFGVKILFNS